MGTPRKDLKYTKWHGPTCWWVRILSSSEENNCFHASNSGARPEAFSTFKDAWQYLEKLIFNWFTMYKYRLGKAPSHLIVMDEPTTYLKESEIFPTSASMYAYISLYGWKGSRIYWELPSTFAYSYTSVLCCLHFTEIRQWISEYLLHIQSFAVKQTVPDLNGFRAGKRSRTLQVVCANEA